MLVIGLWTRFLALLSLLLILVMINSPLVAVEAFAPALTEWNLPAGKFPFGIVSDHDGNVRYACGNGVVGELDPHSNTFNEWSTSSYAYNPHCLQVWKGMKVDGQGAYVYFTDRTGDQLCALSAQGDGIAPATIPTTNSAPFGLFLEFPTPYLPSTPKFYYVYGRIGRQKVNNLRYSGRYGF